MPVDEQGEALLLFEGGLVYAFMVAEVMTLLRRGVIFQFSSDGSLTVHDPTGRLSDAYATLLQEAPTEVEVILDWLRDTDGVVH